MATRYESFSLGLPPLPHGLGKHLGPSDKSSVQDKAGESSWLHQAHSAVAPEKLETETYHHETHHYGTDVPAAGCRVATGCGQQEQ